MNVSVGSPSFGYSARKKSRFSVVTIYSTALAIQRILSKLNEAIVWIASKLEMRTRLAAGIHKFWSFDKIQP